VSNTKSLKFCDHDIVLAALSHYGRGFPRSSTRDDAVRLRCLNYPTKSLKILVVPHADVLQINDLKCLRLCETFYEAAKLLCFFRCLSHVIRHSLARQRTG
jgi:hypothetical protein